MIERVRETLRESPRVAPDPRAVARVLGAVWAAPKPSRWRQLLDAWRVPALSGFGASAIVGAALVVGFVGRGALIGSRAPGEVAFVAPAPGETPGETPVVNAAAVAGEPAAVPTQFVFDSRTARRVAIVGEFNGWDAKRSPLTRLPSGLWTVSLPLTPGRHVYAFVLDDTLVVADPRAPKAGDVDYGREGSVVMVFAR
jgi:hypothetical protein